MASLILIGGITEALVQRVQTAPSARDSTAAFIDEIARVIVPMTGRGQASP